MKSRIGIWSTRGLLIVSASAGLIAQSLAAAEANAVDKALPSRTADSAAAGSADREAAMGALRGVTLAPGGFSLAAVNIVIHSLTGSTDRQLVSDTDGVFAVKDLQPGTYQIVASKEGFTTPPPATVEVARAKTINTSVQLSQAFGSLRGVTLAPGGFSLGEATVIIHSLAGGSTDRQLVSDADGVFKLDDLQPGAYQITASKEKLTTPAATAVEIAENKTANANVLLASANTPVDPPAATPAAGQPATASAPPAVDLQTPFAYGDFTWMNGTPRNHDVVLDTPFFTPEIRFDTNFINDFNQPKDHTMGGSTEEFRNGEFQIEDIGIGGDFHWQNVRGRIMFMDGLFAVTTPRNDASSATGSAGGNTGGVGQWDLQSAYKYVSEAYGGYHFNVQHGLNVDAGIFVSYVGLFSYYNFDNWTYQPSYVSSNTPWFFQGVRIQWFPTNKLKIEPWIIDGWQSYAKYNSHLGLGGQLLWMPKEWFKLVANQYGYGEDNLGLPQTQRIHTDDSIEVRYFNKPESTGIDKMAFSFTADAGCQYGGGITCHGGPNKSSFLGTMLYNRVWWDKDKFALTLGGGVMNNTGRYLTLLPPIDGAWAAVGSAYFTALPGQQAIMWDSTLTFHYMPKQYITWWAEVGYRHSDVPYFSGREGITPPGGNNGLPQYYTCMSGASSMTNNLSAATAACGGPGNVWFPDLRRSTSSLGFGVMVKF